jgi:putative tryptophan/tyrosine transport system substrate-binding protein
MSNMQRREFLALLAGIAAGWPGAATAQKPKVARLGALIYSTPADATMEFVRQGLRNLGYVEGRDIAFEYRFAEGKPERLPELAAELTRLKPDVIVAVSSDVAPFARQASQTIPLVFVASADPEQIGLVASLSRPGGNATGVTLLQDALATKRLGLFKEAAPRISKVAFITNPDHADNELREARRAAQALAIQLLPFEVRSNRDDFERAFQAIVEVGADAIYVVSSRHTVLNMPAIVNFATRSRLPLAGGWGAWAKAGGLLAYGPNVGDVARRAASYVDRILKGAKPSELPVEQPTKFELVVNLITARALGLEIPPTLLARADEVIE